MGRILRSTTPSRKKAKEKICKMERYNFIGEEQYKKEKKLMEIMKTVKVI